jgi:hypothetical protein
VDRFYLGNDHGPFDVAPPMLSVVNVKLMTCTHIEQLLMNATNKAHESTKMPRLSVHERKSQLNGNKIK